MGIPPKAIFESVLNVNEVLPHRAHQLDGTWALCVADQPERGRVIPRAFALFDEVGAGKTKQCVDAAQVLFQADEIDTVVVITPGFARSTWAEPDPTLGEVAKHAWPIIPNTIHEFHGKRNALDFSASGLHWVVSNYEYVRRDQRRDELIAALKGRRTWLILDESWCVKGNSDQTKACWMIRRKRADMVTLLNGTPLADGKPMDLYYQFAILDPAIIGAKNKTHFRAKYCIMGGFQNRNVIDYQNLDDLNKRVAPYVLSRRTRDCFDLPPMLPPITIEAPLTDATWKTYREMRDEMATWIGNQASVSKQAIVKMLRLMQITSGYLGGLESVTDEDDVPLPLDAEPVPQWLKARLKIDDVPHVQAPAPASSAPTVAGGAGARLTKEIGREKLDAFLHWLSVQPKQPDNLIVWCRFRPELERTTRELEQHYPVVMQLKGGQKKDERRAAKALLAPGSKQRGAVVGNQSAGGASLNFSAANIMVFLSNGLALIQRTQSIGRIERPGATQPMLVVDVVACGPKGQKTIDHHVLKALRKKEDLANWTVNQWRQILKDE
jgi:hypothetical protein